MVGITMRKLLLLRLVFVGVGVLFSSTMRLAAGSSIIDVNENLIKSNNIGLKDKQKTIENVEKSLLSLLGMASRPRPKGRPQVPDSLKELYAIQNNIGAVNIAKRGLHTRSANTVRSFSHNESPLDDQFSTHNYRLSFDLSSLPSKEILQAAELSLTRVALPIDSESSNSKKLGRLLVHDIVRPGIKGQRKPILRLVDSKLIDITMNSTISLDVHPAVSRWINEKEHNYGLLIQLHRLNRNKNSNNREKKETHIRFRRSAAEPQDTWVSLRPTLYTYTDDGRHKMSSASEIMDRRAKRAASKKNRRKNGQENCRRYPLYLNFEAVGWNDWIVAPPGYEAYYCHGDCPFPLADHLNSTNHAIVQNLIHNKVPTRVPKACCIPTALNSISMLYLDSNNKVVMKNYQDMTVIGCGCR